MSRPFLTSRSRPWPLYVLLAAAALVIAVAAGLAAETAFSRPPFPSYRLPRVPPVTAAATAPPPAARTRAASVAGGPVALRVLRGARGAGGIRTGFPDTTAGAVSAAVEDWRVLGSDLDPARAARAGRVIADPSWRHAPAVIAAGVRGTRRSLGLPASGPVPAGTRLTLTPVEYQVTRARASMVTVALLAYYAAVLPGQAPQVSIVACPLALHWHQGEWTALPPGTGAGRDWAALAARPGTRQAAADGWHPLELPGRLPAGTEARHAVRHH
ncbi:MAG TPA: hypothetical protein VGG25_19110 [Streptosporangiaceae bacterium]|jgi:hypothetical protein